MTPAQVEQSARRRYNAESQTTFYSQDEIFKIIYEAESILSKEGLVIEDVDTSISTVDGTREYAYPTDTLDIKRIEYNGIRLQVATFREDDILTLDNSATVSKGNPHYYQLFADTIYLRPIPDSVKTLTVFRRKEPTLLTTSSTALSVPTWCHHYLIDYTTMMIALKDENTQVASFYERRWENGVVKVREWSSKRKRGDSPAHVKPEEAVSEYTSGYTW